MVPRTPELQGVLGGIIGAIAYFACWLVVRVLYWAELVPSRGMPRWLVWFLLVSAVVISIIAIWMVADWQNSIRLAWDLPAVDASARLRIALIAVGVFTVLLLLGRLFATVTRRMQRRGQRYLPSRLARPAGLVLAFAIMLGLIDGIAVRGILRVIDNGARLADAIIPTDIGPPASPLVSGALGSPLDWQDLGRWGRSFVSSGPTAADLSDYWGAAALQPIRVYVGLNAADTAQERAQLAFKELQRLDGFSRAVMVIATPTGSGWLDPGAMDTLEYITGGDVASVAVQYSYLPSPVSVVVDPAQGVAEAQALFNIIYHHWTNLPTDARPQLYLHGLSLGAFLSQETLPLLDLYADPIAGALWTGSPYLSEFWQMVQSRRQADSPAWRPRFGNGSLVRTSNQMGGLNRSDADWGPMRFVLLQYGSDPIVFFDWSLAWNRPDWLTGERAPDVSPQMRWIPVVTLLQVGLDMAVALGTLGYGHDYAARHYIPAWAETLAPEGWTAQEEARLIAHLSGLVPR